MPKRPPKAVLCSSPPPLLCVPTCRAGRPAWTCSSCGWDPANRIGPFLQDDSLQAAAFSSLPWMILLCMVSTAIQELAAQISAAGQCLCSPVCMAVPAAPQSEAAGCWSWRNDVKSSFAEVHFLHSQPPQRGGCWGKHRNCCSLCR